MVFGTHECMCGNNVDNFWGFDMHPEALWKQVKKIFTRYVDKFADK